MRRPGARRRGPFSLGLALLLAAACWQPSASLAQQQGGLRVVPVGEGVYAVLQPRELRFRDGNAGFVIGDREVLIYDATSGERGARQIAAAVRERTDLPVKWIVNSHWHNDHVLGNATLAEEFPEATFVGSSMLGVRMGSTGREMLEAENLQLEEAIAAARIRLEQGVDREGNPLGERRELLADQIEQVEAQVEAQRRWLAAPRKPTLSFPAMIDIDLGGQVVHLRAFSGHTDSDVVARVGDGVLFTGDLLDEMPYAGHADLESWVEALHEVSDMRWRVVVPGHGDPLRSKDDFARVVDWIRAARAETFVDACEALEGTGPLEEHRQAFVPEGDALAERAYDQFALDLRKKACEEGMNDEAP